MEKKEAPPITTESFLAFVGQAFGRKLSETETEGLTSLTQEHTPEVVQGYFLSVLAKAEQKELTVEEYLIKGRKKPLLIQSKISQLIASDNAPVKNTDRLDREKGRDMSLQRGHLDFRDYPDDKYPDE